MLGFVARVSLGFKCIYNDLMGSQVRVGRATTIIIVVVGLSVIISSLPSVLVLQAPPFLLCRVVGFANLSIKKTTSTPPCWHISIILYKGALKLLGLSRFWWAITNGRASHI